MMQVYKKTLALLLAIMMVFAVASCKSKKKPIQTGDTDGDSSLLESSMLESDDGDILKPNETSSTTDSQSGTTNNPGGDNSQSTLPPNNDSSKQIALFGNLKGTTVRVVVGPTQTDWEKAFYKEFKEKYQLKALDLVVYSYAEQQTKLPMIVASQDSKNYLDACTTGPTTLLRYIYGNVLVPIDKYIDKSDAGWNYAGTDPKKPQSMLDLYAVDGHYYGCPSYGYHEAFIFYNKTYFNENNVKDPYTQYYLKDNWNFETFKQVAKDATKFEKDGKTVKTYGFATWNYFSFLQAANNSAIVQKGTGKWAPSIDQPSGVAALQLLYDCSANGWFTQNISGYTEFVERKTAMLIERPGNAMASNDCYNRMTDEIGMVPMPKWRNSDPYYAPTTADGWGVPACSKNQAGAAAFIYEYTQATRKRDEAKSGYGYENRRRVLSDEHYKIREEYLKKAQLNVSLIDGLAGWYTGNRSDFFNIMFVEKVKPANALDRMMPLINSSIKNTIG